MDSVVKTSNIYLTEAEFLQLFNHKFKTPYLCKAADLFLLGAWSSFRDSDFQQLLKENIEVYKGREIIKVQTVKKKKPVAIPLHDGIKKIKRSGGSPTLSANKKLNVFIKDAGEAAGITQNNVTYESRGSV